MFVVDIGGPCFIFDTGVCARPRIEVTDHLLPRLESKSFRVAYLVLRVSFGAGNEHLVLYPVHFFEVIHRFL